MLRSAGGAALGLAWGWWMSGRGPMHRRARTVLAYAVATAAIAAEVAIFLGTRLVPAFVGASLASLWLHLAWRQALMKRFGPIDPTKEVA